MLLLLAQALSHFLPLQSLLVAFITISSLFYYFFLKSHLLSVSDTVTFV